MSMTDGGRRLVRSRFITSGWSIDTLGVII
jgi:hypothetical protein